MGEIGAELAYILSLSLLALLILFGALALLFAGFFPVSPVMIFVKILHRGKILHEGHGARAAELEIAVFKHIAELLADFIELILRYAHGFDNLLYGTDIHFHGAFEAETLLRGLVALNLRHEKHRRSLFAF